MTNCDRFINGIHQCIDYWDKQNYTSKGKMEGLMHSILCMLDGVSGSFDGNIDDLAKDSEDIMLHELFHTKDLK